MTLLQAILERGDWVFNTGYALLIIFFCFFYTAVTFQPVDVADNLKKQQANIPGIRPGKQTADYIDRVLQRITFGGVDLRRGRLRRPVDHRRSASTCRSAAAGRRIMIVVGVALDTVSQIEAHLITRNYEGLTGPGARSHPRAAVPKVEGGRHDRRLGRAARAREGTQAKVICEQLRHPADLDGRHAPRREEGGDARRPTSLEMMDRAGSSRTRS